MFSFVKESLNVKCDNSKDKNDFYNHLGDDHTH